MTKQSQTQVLHKVVYLISDYESYNYEWAWSASVHLHKWIL